MKGFYTVLAIVVGYLPILFFLLLFKWFRRSARKLKPRQLGSSVEFFVSPRMHILIQITLLLLVLFSLLVLSTSLRRGGDGWYGLFIPLTVLVAILLAMPRKVIVDSHGIRQQRLLRADRQIQWGQIAWMRRGVNSGTTYVKSKNGGRPVSFSPLLVGQSRFEKEVRAHAKGCEGPFDDLDDE